MQAKLKMIRKMSNDSELSHRISELKEINLNYGDYRRTLLHFHTPASHDYRVLPTAPKRTYQAYTENEIEKIARDRNLFRFPKFQKNNYLQNMVEKNSLFTDYKELLSYLLIGDTLFRKQIDLAIITDHNTISGYDKLKDAINILKKGYGGDVPYPHIQLGIEVSCGDSLHVVAIFDEQARNSIMSFLEEKLVTEHLGTFLPSWEVIEKVNNLGGIAYVAHFNSTDVLNDDEFGRAYSGAYKKRLLSPVNMKLVGLSDLEKVEPLKAKFRRDRGIEDVTVLYDEDSHELESLGTKTFWLKGQKIDYNMILNAVHDPDISIRYIKPKLPDAYVKSVYIEGNGFLGKEANNFSVSFSTALNCIIGGRGSGKSTLLDCIGFILSRKVDSISELENICSQGRIALRVSYQKEDYYVFFSPVIDGYHSKMFVRSYLYGVDRSIQYSSRLEKIDNDAIAKATLQKIQIFTVRDSNIHEVKNKKDFLDTIFKTVYSINELVKFATDDRITDFIRQQLALNNHFLKKVRISRIKDDEHLEKECNEIDDRLKKRYEEVQEIIEPFNKKTGNLKLVYSQTPTAEYEFEWLNNINLDVFHGRLGWFENYNVSEDGLYNYLNDLSNKIVLPHVYLLFMQKDWKKINSMIDIKKYVEERSFADIENGIIKIGDENINEVLSNIYKKILKPARGRIYDFFASYYAHVDVFDLEFDINSYENENIGPKFKPIQQVSLGQKVVALLDFIFAYGDLNGDTTPLLLDQPEDNLDSSYIYQHLVTSFKREKDKRQVIVVTHNSTIVTNSKPEEVISMKSDNLHGWIENSGYPTETEVIKRVINLLEGGHDSFIHKEFIYNPVLKDME